GAPAPPPRRPRSAPPHGRGPDAAARAPAAPPTSPRRRSRRWPRSSASSAPPCLLLPPYLARRLRALGLRGPRPAALDLRPVAAAVAVVSRRGPRRPLLRRGGSRHQAACDQPLTDRPEVRRHPVENEAGRESRDH